MHFSLLAILTYALTALASPAPRASNSWAGVNNYFLQSLNDNEQKQYLSQLKDAGVKVIRLWVNGQPGNGACIKGCQSVKSVPELETTVKTINYETLHLLDQTLVYVQQSGLKVLISPHDGNQLNGANGNDIYGQTWGAGYFYTDSNAAAAYDNRLYAILNYKGKYSGMVWKNWNQVIMGFDIQNEPFAAKKDICNSAAAKTWVCNRSSRMREYLGSQNSIKVISGGFGGDISQGCTFSDGAKNCPSLDVISVHAYAGPESSNQGQWSRNYKSWLNQSNGKLVLLEEWGIDTSVYDPRSEFPANTKDMNSAGLPWMYWQILPKQTCSVSGDSDQFGIHVDYQVGLKQAATSASGAQSAQNWNGVV